MKLPKPGRTAPSWRTSCSRFTQSGQPSFEVGVAAGGPVVDETVGVRASLWTRYDGGYIDRYNFFTNALTAQNTNSIQSYVGHVSVLAKATDSLTITPSISRVSGLMITLVMS